MKFWPQTLIKLVEVFKHDMRVGTTLSSPSPLCMLCVQAEHNRKDS